MVDPVITADGQTYERAAIEKWFAEGHTTSPSTGLSLESLALIPNLALRKTREEYVNSLLKAAQDTAADGSGGYL
jgi:hypothetical protein